MSYPPSSLCDSSLLSPFCERTSNPTERHGLALNIGWLDCCVPFLTNDNSPRLDRIDLSKHQDRFVVKSPQHLASRSFCKDSTFGSNF
ncbi:uncharacterized protein QC763_0039670 [Podospora pseudopauciseta]|uniref:Uncharacterized protein n=2 Tax=Podospora TaxID=5144 RepID=A0ABR0HPW8_9PEZI|nr:hypothetical protein QC763_0039670 [Podospora pseudopauciseta]KAK4679990.1 hypothetical protein QC764_0040440 [Podospora pseudoanserina]